MKPLTFVALLFSAHLAFGDTRGIDTNFGVGGAVLLAPTPASQQNMIVYAIAVRDDGKIIIGGKSTDGTSQPAVGRLNTDGSWDETFGDHGLFVLPAGANSEAVPTGGEIRHVFALSNGGILASGGSFGLGTFKFSTCTLLMKITASGTLDATFNTGGLQCFNFGPPTDRNGNFDGIVVNADDSFYLTAPTPLTHGAVARFDANGQLVDTFGDAGIAALPENIFTDLLLADSSGHLIAVGLKKIGADTEIAAVRLDATSGAIDDAFGTSGVFTADHQQVGIVQPSGVSMDSAGRLVIADDDLTDFGFGEEPYKFYRVNPSGLIDTSFNSAAQQPGFPGFAEPPMSGAIYTDSVLDVRALPDGHLFAVGRVLEPGTEDISDVALLRLDPDAGYDPSFGDDTHPGWTSFNIGMPGSSNDPLSFSMDIAGRGFIVVPVQDGAKSCFAIVRVVPDRLFADTSDSPPLPTTCPQ